MSKLDTPPVEKSYTILRIKRKRNEEPLDALGKHIFSPPRITTDLVRIYQLWRRVFAERNRGLE